MFIIKDVNNSKFKDVFLDVYVYLASTSVLFI